MVFASFIWRGLAENGGGGVRRSSQCAHRCDVSVQKHRITDAERVQQLRARLRSACSENAVVACSGAPSAHTDASIECSEAEV
jgi:hypothetical protein